MPYWKDDRQALPRRRRARRDRDASELRRLQPGDDAAAARDRAASRSAATSIRATCSGRASTSSSAIRALGDSIFHVHAKDCRIDRANTSRRTACSTRRTTPRARALLDLPHRRLRQRRARLEGHRQQPAPGRLRPRAQHRARGQPDVGRRGTEEGDRVPQDRSLIEGAAGDGVLGTDYLNQNYRIDSVGRSAAMSRISSCRRFRRGARQSTSSLGYRRHAAAAQAASGTCTTASGRSRPVVMPGPRRREPVPAPSDAVVLFDGHDLSRWQISGRQAGWLAGRWMARWSCMPMPRRRRLEQRDVRRRPAAHRVRDPGEGRGRRSGSRQQRRVPDGALRSAGARQLREPDLSGRSGGRDLRAVPAARQRLPRPGASGRASTSSSSRRASPTAKLVSPARATVFHNNVLVQHDVTLIGQTVHRVDRHLRTARRSPADQAAGSWESDQIPQYLGETASVDRSVRLVRSSCSAVRRRTNEHRTPN